MIDLLSDVRGAWRVLARSPGFTLVAVGTLALGIGANSAMFSIVNPILLRPLPYPEPGRIVSAVLAPSHMGSRGDVAPHWAYLQWRARGRTLTQAAAYRTSEASVLGPQAPERLFGADVTGDFFSLLGARPVVGRVWGAEEVGPGAPRMVVLAHGTWMRLFAGDTGIIGHTVDFNGSPTTVAGVLPAAFDFPHGSAYWAPFLIPEGLPSGVTLFIQVIGRLAPGAQMAAAAQELSRLSHDEASQHPGPWQDASLDLMSLHQRLFGHSRALLLMLFGAVGLVLLITCANIASMLLAQGASREREFAIRAALGAGRARVARQVLVESTLLSVLGGAAGLLVASWCIGIFAALSPTTVAGAPPIHIDTAALVFTGVVALGTGILFGLAPALSAMRISVVESLKSSSPSVSNPARHMRLRQSLLVGQLSAALVLLIAALLLARSLFRFLSVDPGFRPQGLVSVYVALTPTHYPNAAARNAFLGRLLESASRLRQVELAALADALPLHGASAAYSVRVDGAPFDEGNRAFLNSVTVGYFRTVGSTIAAGRAFTAQDVPGTERVAIVNEAFARRFLGGRDPIGHYLNRPDSSSGRLIIVGEISDIRQIGRDEPSEPEVFLPAAQAADQPGVLVVRTSGGAREIAPAIRQIVRDIDPSQPGVEIATLEDQLARGSAPRRANAILLGVFGAVALLIAALGLYGLMAILVTQRTREIGVRVALGADRKDVLRLVIGQGAVLVASGVILGLFAAMAFTRVLRSMLFGVGATDPATFVAAPIVLAGVAILAAYLPARRAMSVDPVVALRSE